MKLNQRGREETREARENLEVKGRECSQDGRGQGGAQVKAARLSSDQREKTPYGAGGKGFTAGARPVTACRAQSL